MNLIQKTIIICFISMVIPASGTGYDSSDLFNQTLENWLNDIGLKVQLTNIVREYDEDEMIQHFNLKVNELTNKGLSSPTNLELEFGNYEDFGMLEVKILEKDISEANLLADWIVKFAIKYATSELAAQFGLERKVINPKDKNGFYEIILGPNKKTPDSRFRFDGISLKYKIKDQVITAIIRIEMPNKNPIFNTVLTNLDAIIATLARGDYPEIAIPNVISGSKKGSSLDYLPHAMREIGQNGDPRLSEYLNSHLSE